MALTLAAPLMLDVCDAHVAGIPPFVKRYVRRCAGTAPFGKDSVFIDTSLCDHGTELYNIALPASVKGIPAIFIPPKETASNRVYKPFVGYLPITFIWGFSIVSNDCMNEKWKAVIFLTNACNLRCLHCSIWKNNGTEMSLETVKKIADYGPKKINIMGGEPLLHSKFKEVLDIFSNISVTLQTNATLIPENIGLLEGVREVICSIEGLEKNTNRIRGEGMWGKVMKSVEMLKDAGIPAMLRSSLWEGNLKDVPALARISKDMKVPLYFYPMLGKPPLNATQQSLLFRLLSEYENCWLDLPEYFCSLGVRSYCDGGFSRLAFMVDGKVTPCQWIDHVLGYVGDDFGRIEQNADFFSDNMKIRPPECVGCNWSETCKGGCIVAGAWYLGCPLRPQVRKYMEFNSNSFGGRGKAEAVKILLKNVVTC